MMRRALLWLVDQYQKAAFGRPSPCRFFPSCSEYAKEALTVHGAGRGSWLTVRRLARCRPFGPSGFDPVPDIRTSHHGHDATCGHHTSTRSETAGPTPMKVS